MAEKRYLLPVWTDTRIRRYHRTERRRIVKFSLQEALTRAERDLKHHWPAYRERFLRGEFP